MDMKHRAFSESGASRRQLLQMGGLGAAAAIGLARADPGRCLAIRFDGDQSSADLDHGR